MYVNKSQSSNLNFKQLNTYFLSFYGKHPLKQTSKQVSVWQFKENTNNVPERSGTLRHHCCLPADRLHHTYYILYASMYVCVAARRLSKRENDEGRFQKAQDLSPMLSYAICNCHISNKILAYCSKRRTKNGIFQKAPHSWLC